MDAQLERALPIVAAWGAWALVALLALAMLMIWRLGAGRRFLIPARWPGRTLSVAAIGIAAASALGLFCLVGPLRPLMGQVRTVSGVVGRPAGEIDFKRVSDESPQRLSDLHGKVVMVNLWATWCPPCRREMPEINRLQTAYADRGLVVVTLSNEERERLLRFAEQVPFATLNGYTSQLGWLDVPGRPLTVVIDRRGVVRELMLGARTFDEFSAKVEKYLDARS